MHNSKKKVGRKVLAGAAIGAASIAMVLSAATAASAATGTRNEGIRNLTVTPVSPATDFSVPGTAGTVSWDVWDGNTTPNTLTLAPGQTMTRVITLPAGLAFDASACGDGADSSESFHCTISADGRTRTMVGTALTSASLPAMVAPNVGTVSVHSTGLVSGQITGTFSPYPGSTTQAPTASGTVPGFVPFAASGATGPDGSGNYTLTGTAQPGASITVKDATGATVGTATADANGNWSATIPSGVTPPLSITQSVGGQTSAPIEFNTAPLPVMNGVVAAGAIALAGLGFGGVRLFRRSRVTA